MIEVEARHEVRLHELAEALDVGVLEFVDGVCTWANRAYLDIVGLSMAAALGGGWLDSLHPDDHASIAALRETEGPARMRVRHLRPDGDLRYVDATIVPLEVAEGRRVRSVVSAHDVTDSVLRTRAELEQERRFRQVFDSAAVGMAVVRHDGTVVDVNPAYCQLIRIRPEDIVGRLVQDVVRSPDGPYPWTQAVAALGVAPGGRFGVDCPVVRPDGSSFWARASMALGTWNGDDQIVIAQLLDIDEQHRQRLELAHRADHDELTGLPNRSAVLAEITDRLCRNQGLLAVLFCDLDRFKDVNDSLGHAAGDEVLRAVADGLRSSVRGSDVVGRLGGDEFVVLLGEVDDVAAAQRTADRVRAALAAPVLVAGQPVSCGVSVGIAVVDLAEAHELSASDVLRDADTAMYDAKAAGRGGVRIFSAEMRDRVVRRMAVEGDLRRAVEQREFVLHYQPIVRLEDGVRKGFEALVRWNHPVRGVLLPWEFLGVAEDCGLASAIDDIVLEDALGFLSRHPGTTVSVNTSPRRFDGSFAPLVADGLRRYGVEGRRLFVELLETSLIEANEHTSSELAALADLGCPVMIDDFGTGYSALSYLRRLPVSGLKLDRSFVTDLPRDVDSDRIAAAVVGLAGSFGLMGVAEGVETADQAAHLLAQGWAYAQGWHFGRPAPEDTWYPREP